MPFNSNAVAPVTAPSLSVIIPVYNGANHLAACLGALAQSTHPNFEVLLVDDGSTDDSVGIAQRLGFTVLQLHGNCGPSVARNVGAAQARSAVLFFLDADILVQADSLQRISARLDAEPGLDALFGSFVPESVPRNFCSRYKNLIHHYTHQHSSEVASTFCGGFGAIRKHVFLAAGQFDPSHRFLEDVELGLRLHRGGKYVLLWKTLQFQHCKHYTFTGLLRSDFYQRALPWANLILTTGVVRNDLNTKSSNVASVGASFAMLATLLCFSRPAFATFAALGALFIWLNRGFFRLVLHHCGPWFLMRTMFTQWITYLCSGLAVCIALARYGVAYLKENASDTETVR